MVVKFAGKRYLSPCFTLHTWRTIIMEYTDLRWNRYGLARLYKIRQRSFSRSLCKGIEFGRPTCSDSADQRSMGFVNRSMELCLNLRPLGLHFSYDVPGFNVWTLFLSNISSSPFFAMGNYAELRRPPPKNTHFDLSSRRSTRSNSEGLWSTLSIETKDSLNKHYVVCL